MEVRKLSIKGEATIPLIAALPYGVTVDEGSYGPLAYDPRSQLTASGRRDFSTCREDESAGGFFQSKSDTKKDD